MIDMALLSVLRRWHFREGMPIREITRRTGLSRNTVRKYLASGETGIFLKIKQFSRLFFGLIQPYRIEKCTIAPCPAASTKLS